LKQEKEKRLQNNRNIPGKGSQKPQLKVVMFMILLSIYFLLFKVLEDLDWPTSFLSWIIYLVAVASCADSKLQKE
jgi:hypothetical protein